jgi:hypothetical protein
MIDFVDGGARPSELAQLADVAARVPILALTLGPSIHDLGAACDRILDSIR